MTQQDAGTRREALCMATGHVAATLLLDECGFFLGLGPAFSEKALVVGGLEIVCGFASGDDMI